MDCFLTSLKVEGGRLLGKRFFRPWRPIEPQDIAYVREYALNNPFLEIRTTAGTFRVGIRHPQYDLVVRYLAENTAFDLSGDRVHNLNVALHKTSLTDLVRSIFRKQK